MSKSQFANDIIRISGGRQSLGKVKNITPSWGMLTATLSKPQITQETFKQYMALKKEEQDLLKNVNGFWIGSHCIDGRRKKTNLRPRDVLALDFDNMTPALLSKIMRREFNILKRVEFFIHTTRKHTAEKPRIRMVFPLAKPCQIDDYTALSRIVAWSIDKTMEAVDDVSFRPAQMMYNPSHSRDAEFIAKLFAGEMLLDPRDVFKAFRARDLDPHNHLHLPYSESQGQKRLAAEKAEDPWEKDGIVGAFCRAFPIEQAIAEFLPEDYGPGDMSGAKPRYTYLKGTTANGVEIQDDGRFLYSHHTSDPLSDMLVNAFDAVRIVKFGALDEKVDEDTPIGKRPSFKKMVEFAQAIPAVKKDLVERRFSDVEEAFDDLDPEPEDDVHPSPPRTPDVPSSRELSAEELELLGPSVDDAEEGGGRIPADAFDDLPADPDEEIEKSEQVSKAAERPPEDWRQDLDATKDGGLKKTIYNYSVIFQNDSRFYKRFADNEMLQGEVLYRPITSRSRFGVDLPVRDRENGDRIEDYMVAQMRTVLEGPAEFGGYGFPNAPTTNVNAAISLAAKSYRFHPVRNLVKEGRKPVIWDKVPRLETVLQRYFKVEDNPYIREAFRLMMLAAVTRAFEPGHKFDFCLIIQGEQGIGKSSFLEMLGRYSWYAVFDCGFDDVQKAVEKMQGHSIMEIGEMSAYHKSDMDAIKQFLSTTKDTVRLAYAHRAKEYHRQAVFFGTVNTDQFLRDLTGNRRMWPVKATLPRNVPFDFTAFAREVDQLWAEAYAIYAAMRAAKPKGSLYLDLSDAARPYAIAAQDGAQMETQAEIWGAQMAAWLETPVSKEEALNGGMTDRFDDLDGKLYLRTCVSTSQLWLDCLQMRREDLRPNQMQFSAAQSRIPGWRREDSRKKHKFDGVMLRALVREDATEAQIWERIMPYVELDDSDLTG
ncbi:hypothetical protein GTW51_07525 [Aurantimonas aggregata]|uniref:Virulence-associated protein E-like domain-containing protein n=1 Tax=Aurantimonas aggregata TaxID=2047720 RepID=A0A6L9MFH1_9HYPH|nr:VapE domain-containing protein [Aurantimonas aggregata]NDV86547.1 hypothetical protein [Aurantimonas aggregata]